MVAFWGHIRLKFAENTSNADMSATIYDSWQFLLSMFLLSYLTSIIQKAFICAFNVSVVGVPLF